MLKHSATPSTQAALKSPRINAMTIDVEDYFQVGAFKSNISRSTWDSLPCRVEKNVDLLLDTLAEKKVQATFFTLGWVAERYASMVRKIVANGHELASHGYGHEMITDLDQKSFKQDVIRAKATLEDVSGIEIKGYRAPSFSVGHKTLWAHDILAETGHIYSSSVYPIKHDLYGMPDSPRFAYRLPNGLVEIPVTSVRLSGVNFPASGGGFFRLFPLWLSKSIITRVNSHDQQAAIFYCHPWEFDPAQPRIQEASAKSKFRHYVNLEKNQDKFNNLLDSFQWAPMNQTFASVINQR
jgi:polysaccharide deacetylase family protein (PEP-CTERM system associated)